MVAGIQFTIERKFTILKGRISHLVIPLRHFSSLSSINSLLRCSLMSDVYCIEIDIIILDPPYNLDVGDGFE